MNINTISTVDQINSENKDYVIESQEKHINNRIPERAENIDFVGRWVSDCNQKEYIFSDNGEVKYNNKRWKYTATANYNIEDNLVRITNRVSTCSDTLQEKELKNRNEGFIMSYDKQRLIMPCLGIDDTIPESKISSFLPTEHMGNCYVKK